MGNAVAVGELLDRAVGVVASRNGVAVGDGPSSESPAVTVSEVYGVATPIHCGFDNCAARV